jgi:hypothetical protein
MTEQAENLVIELLRAIRKDQAETNLKIGSLAESMVSMRKDINGLETRIGSLEIAVQGVRADMRMIAIAADEHTHRLDKIEARLPPLHAV